MAVSIRLTRIGGKNDPCYRIVIKHARSARDGKFIELIGNYDPKKTGVNYAIDLARADYWVSKGAQPSDTVRSIIKKAHKAAAAQA